MNTWFEVKVKYEKIDANGREKMVTEPYLIDAVSFTDAEARTHKELEPYISGKFNVVQMKIANFSDVIFNDDGDRYFKAKVAFISIDEEKGTEKKSNTYMLVQANDLQQVKPIIDEHLKDCVSDYEVPAVNETKIMDVFMYREIEDSAS